MYATRNRLRSCYYAHGSRTLRRGKTRRAEEKKYRNGWICLRDVLLNVRQRFSNVPENPRVPRKQPWGLTDTFELNQNHLRILITFLHLNESYMLQDEVPSESTSEFKAL